MLQPPCTPPFPCLFRLFFLLVPQCPFFFLHHASIRTRRGSRSSVRSILLGVCSFAATVARRQLDGRSFCKEAWQVLAGFGVHKPHMQRSTSTLLCFFFQTHTLTILQLVERSMYDMSKKKIKNVEWASDNISIKQSGCIGRKFNMTGQ